MHEQRIMYAHKLKIQVMRIQNVVVGTRRHAFAATHMSTCATHARTHAHTYVRTHRHAQAQFEARTHLASEEPGSWVPVLASELRRGTWPFASSRVLGGEGDGDLGRKENTWSQLGAAGSGSQFARMQTYNQLVQDVEHMKVRGCWQGC